MNNPNDVLAALADPRYGAVVFVENWTDARSDSYAVYTKRDYDPQSPSNGLLVIDTSNLSDETVAELEEFAHRLFPILFGGTVHEMSPIDDPFAWDTNDPYEYEFLPDEPEDNTDADRSAYDDHVPGWAKEP